MALVKMDGTGTTPRRGIETGSLVYCQGCGVKKGGVMVFDGNNRRLCVDCGGKYASPLRSDTDVWEGESSLEED